MFYLNVGECYYLEILYKYGEVGDVDEKLSYLYFKWKFLIWKEYELREIFLNVLSFFEDDCDLNEVKLNLLLSQQVSEFVLLMYILYCDLMFVNEEVKC